MLFFSPTGLIPVSRQVFYWSTILVLIALVLADCTVDESTLGCDSNVAVFEFLLAAQTGQKYNHTLFGQN